MATRSFAETGGPSPRQARSSLLTSSRTVLLSPYVLPICLLCEFSPICPIGWTTRLLWPGKRYCSIHVYQLTGTVRATFPQRHQRLHIRPQNHSAGAIFFEITCKFPIWRLGGELETSLDSQQYMHIALRQSQNNRASGDS